MRLWGGGTYVVEGDVEARAAQIVGRLQGQDWAECFPEGRRWGGGGG